MSRTGSGRTAPRRTCVLAALGVVVASAAIIGTLAHESAVSSAPTSAPSSAPASAPPFSDVPRVDHGAVTAADGSLPDGVTVFDDGFPGVANVDPDLLRVLREAATDAADDGIRFYVNSGWRSPDYQNQLLREAVSEYGSEEEAARWVATAETSAHVSGDAIDIGPFDAAAWLSQHGAAYGLCQIYANESWHYEQRAETTSHGCPPMYADPTHDPRMHG